MQTFALIENNIVTEIIEIGDDQNIHDMYHPDFVARMVDVSEMDPKPACWWSYINGVFAPPNV